jgi:hypothetical protein
MLIVGCVERYTCSLRLRVVDSGCILVCGFLCWVFVVSICGTIVIIHRYPSLIHISHFTIRADPRVLIKTTTPWLIDTTWSEVSSDICIDRDTAGNQKPAPWLHIAAGQSNSGHNYSVRSKHEANLGSKTENNTGLHGGRRKDACKQKHRIRRNWNAVPVPAVL